MFIYRNSKKCGSKNGGVHFVSKEMLTKQWYTRTCRTNRHYFYFCTFIIWSLPPPSRSACGIIQNHRPHQLPARSMLNRIFNPVTSVHVYQHFNWYHALIFLTDIVQVSFGLGSESGGEPRVEVGVCSEPGVGGSLAALSPHPLLLPYPWFTCKVFSSKELLSF